MVSMLGGEMKMKIFGTILYILASYLIVANYGWLPLLILFLWTWAINIQNNES